MFYKVGRYKSRSFIYDTEDNSCELIKNTRLNLLDMKISAMKQPCISINKVRLMYNLEDGVWTGYEKHICYYKLIIKDTDYCYSITCSLDFRFIPSNCIDIYDTKLDSLSGGVDDYVVLCVLTIIDHQSIFGDEDIDLSISNKSYLSRYGYEDALGTMWGIQVPFVMFRYVMELARNKDFYGIMKSFGGVFSKDLKIESVSIFYVDRVDSVDWNVSRWYN